MERPNFALIAVSTIDGKIARHPGHMSDWSSKEDKDFLHKMLGKSDAVIVGRNTYETAKKPLSKRNCIVFTRSVPAQERSNGKPVFLNPAATDISDYCSRNSILKVAVLGGAKTFNYFLANGLADEIYLTIEPIAFGAGIPLFDSGDKDVFFGLVSVKKLNRRGTVLLHYRKNPVKGVD